MAARLREMSLGKGDGKASANDVAQGILWVVEGYQQNHQADEQVPWTVVQLDLDGEAMELRANAGLPLRG